MIIYFGKLLSSKGLLELIGEISKVVEYKINTQKFIVFLLY